MVRDITNIITMDGSIDLIHGRSVLVEYLLMEGTVDEMEGGSY